MSLSRDIRLWPVLCLLLIVVLLPTACLLWMMTKAIDNERLAVRQILADACRGQLVRLQSHWDEHWQAQAKLFDDAAAGKSPQEAFAAIVRDGLANSAIVCGDRHHPAYPSLPSSTSRQRVAPDAAWTQAEQLEHVAQQPAEAAQAYAVISKDTADADIAAQANVAQARCLARDGRRDEAIDLFANTLAGERFARATDADGRLIAADAELRALELIGNPADARFQEIAIRLTNRLTDYSDPLLGSAQRRFLFNSLARISGVQPASDNSPWKPALQDAEKLAADVLELGTALGGNAILQPSGVPDVWQFASAGADKGPGRIVALFRTETIVGQLRAMAANARLSASAGIELLPPNRMADSAKFLYMLPAGNLRFNGTMRCWGAQRPTAR
jgi:hypothetical protein